MTESRYETGTRVRREVLGDKHVDRAQARQTAFDADFQRYITESAWGAVWARPDLDRRTRSLVTIAPQTAPFSGPHMRAHSTGGPACSIRRAASSAGISSPARRTSASTGSAARIVARTASLAWSMESF